jgi:2-polyprenyl-3-methyl-5-hydroxy-6-metoxy-1,4-benzoquinol methylase
MSCPACASSNHQYFATKNNYALNKCSVCDLIFVATMPSDKVLHDFYQNYHKTSQYTAKLKSKLKRAKKRISRVKRHVHGNKFLDVGCNFGFAVEAARQLNFDAQGIDIDETTISLAKQCFPDATFQAKSIQDVASSNKKFDFIYCSEVIEHLQTLDDFVKALYDCLDEKGFLYLTTPDIGHYSLPSKTDKLIEWDAIRPPEHLHYFSKKSLQLLFSNAGFNKLKFSFNLKPTLKLLAWKN